MKNNKKSRYAKTFFSRIANLSSVNRDASQFPAAACSAATLLLLLSSNAGAVEWTFTPRLGASETYSDNIGLAPSGREKSDFVTQLTPGFSVNRVGPRLNLNANYSLQTLFYANDSSNNTLNHMLDAHGNAELVENLFFLDAKAGISQQNISLLGPQAADNINTTGNRTEVRTLSLSPYLRKNFGTMATGEARYTHEDVDASGTGFDSKTDRVNLRLDSGPAYTRLGWGLSYYKDKVDFASFQEVEREVYTGSLRYLLRPGFSLVGNAGREKNTYLYSGPKPEGSFWSAGFAWAITPRTDLNASIGRRFFGDTHAIGFSHRTRRTVWDVNYSQDITTVPSQFFVPSMVDTAGYLSKLFASAIPDPIMRQRFVADFMLQSGIPGQLFNPLNFLSNQAFLEKKLLASVALNGAKNTIVLNLFNQIRDAQSIGAVTSPLLGNNDFASSSRIEQRGGGALWNYRFAPRTSSNVSVGYSRNTYSDIDREDRDKYLKIGVTRQIEPKITASLDYRRLQRDSNLSGNEYRENAIIAAVYMTF